MKSYTQFGFIDTPLSGIIILIRSRLLRGLKDFYLLVQLANEWGNREFSRKVADYACAFLRQRFSVGEFWRVISTSLRVL